MAEKTIVLDFEIDVDQSIESIKSLTEANKRLREERNKLNIASEVGQKRAQEINATIDQNTSKIKANVSAIEQQKINIGNYKSALDGVHPALGKVGQGLEAGTQGFKAMTMQALAFIATPVGAILAALVVSFQLLSTFIKNSAVGMDAFEDASAAVGAILEVVVDRVVKFVGALGKLLMGDIKGGLTGMKESFAGIGDEIEREVKMAVALAAAIRDLEDREIDYSIAVGETENAIKRLILQSKNRSLTEAERIKKLEEAGKLEIKQNEENLAIEEERLRIANDAANQKIELARIQGETEIEFGKRIVQAFKEGKAQADELRDAVVDGIKRRQSAESESFNLLEKIENQKAALEEKAAAAREKAIALLREQTEQERALKRVQSGGDTGGLSSEIAQINARAELRIESEFTAAMAILNARERLAKDIKKYNKQIADSDQATAEKSLAMQELVEQQKLDAAVAVTDGILSLVNEQGEAYRAIATAQALISTYSAATKAYEAAFLPVPTVASPAIGTAFAAAAVLQGLANVAKINGIEFAEGGWTGPGRKWDVAGVVHADEYVVPKHIVNNPVGRQHVSALEQMRLAPYADGGMVTRSISNPINQSLELANALKSLGPFEVDVREVTKAQRKIQVKQNISRI